MFYLLLLSNGQNRTCFLCYQPQGKLHEPSGEFHYFASGRLCFPDDEEVPGDFIDFYADEVVHNAA